MALMRHRRAQIELSSNALPTLETLQCIERGFDRSESKERFAGARAKAVPHQRSIPKPTTHQRPIPNQQTITDARNIAVRVG